MSLAIQPLYDKIGATYDATRRVEPAILDVLGELLNLPTGADVLDIGCGTGNYTTALGERGCEMLGLDRSGLMLRTARAKAPGLRLIGADASNLPFRNRAFDGAICTLAIHHFDDLEASFAEAARVLDRGRLVILTALPEQIKRYWLSAYFPRMMAQSAEQMPDWGTIEISLRRAGFRTWTQKLYWMPEQPFDLFLYSGKHQPHLYLDERVRANISAFANLAASDELGEGLERLRHDLAHGRFEQTTAEYEDVGGDYLFIAAQV
ncbi:MAG: class I SAM-dependent methyltransferase [Dongiaceae bacterium]